MSKDIWHKKTEQPKKILHCTRLIITKWGSVYSEKDIDNGAFIETDWAYLDDLLALETELERTRKALDIAMDGLKRIEKLTEPSYKNRNLEALALAVNTFSGEIIEQINNKD